MPNTPVTSPVGEIKQNLVTLTGNHVRIYFAGKPIGYLQNFSGQNDYGEQPLSGIGDAKVQEWVPGMATHTITADRAVVRLKSIYTILGTVGGGTADDFINVDGLLNGKVFDILIVEQARYAAQGNPSTSGNATGGSAAQSTQSQTQVRWWKNCTIAADTVTIGKHAIIYSNLTIHALNVYGNLQAAGANAITDMDDDSNDAAPV